MSISKTEDQKIIAVLKALRKLRHPLRSPRLYTFLDGDAPMPKKEDK